MLLARRDAAFAKGRFALVAGVIALLTLLVALLSGLTNGLGAQSTSGLERAEKEGAVRVLSSADSLGLSRVTEAQAAEARSEAGADAVVPVTLGMVRIESASSENPVQSAVFAAPAPTSWLPSVPEAGVALPAALAEELGVKTGDEVTVNGVPLEVSSVTAPDLHYAHSSVVGLTAQDAAAVLHSKEPNAILTSDASLNVDGLTSSTIRDAFNLIPGYKSEHGSLLLIQVILYVIAGLVVAAFLTIWTLQRTRDLALLRALGASEGYLFKDGMAQAAIVLLGGVIVGGLAGWWLGALAAQAVPFELSVRALAVPALLILGVGLLGALAAVSRVRSVNPLTALGGN